MSNTIATQDVTAGTVREETKVLAAAIQFNPEGTICQINRNLLIAAPVNGRVLTSQINDIKKLEMAKPEEKAQIDAILALLNYKIESK